MRQSMVAAVPPRAAPPLVALVLALAAASGCVQSKQTKALQAAEAEKELAATTVRQSSITMIRNGGLAGLHTEATVDGGKLSYSFVPRRACAAGQTCPPATDSASGAIAQSVAADLFAKVVSEG